jgi:hypothetical protein
VVEIIFHKGDHQKRGYMLIRDRMQAKADYQQQFRDDDQVRLEEVQEESNPRSGSPAQ